MRLGLWLITMAILEGNKVEIGVAMGGALIISLILFVLLDVVDISNSLKELRE